MQHTLVALGAAVPVLVGGLVLRWRPRHPVGWLLVAHGVCFFALLTFDEPATSRAGLIVDQLGMGSWVLLFLWLVLVAYLLPDGRTANRFWRWWVRVGLAGVAVFVVGAAGDREGFADTHDGAALPVPWLPEPWSGLLGLVGLLLVALLFFGGFGAVWWRLRRARGDERLQLLWLVWGALTVPVTLLTGWVHRGEHVGDLAIQVPPDREFAPSDLDLVRDLARYAAILVRSEQLNDALRESRTRIVAGREEERRHLHDSVGPSLAAVVLKLNAAQSRTDAAARNALIAETRDEVKDAIAEVRRLVDDLRPPAIDEVGLLGAIRQRVSSLSGNVTYEVTGPDGFLPLPAAVEVAAFRIASEAMTNVARHSGATRCRVGVAVDGAFALTVSDNGHGADQPTGQGMGWTSMRERAAELGGSCTITSRPEGGLVVRAVLPLTSDEPVTT